MEKTSRPRAGGSIRLKWEKAGTALFLVMTGFIISMQGSLSFFCQGKSSTDSSVFRTMAMLILRGYVPYRDFFDHKGPLIYLINVAGYVIDPVWGTWLLEWIFLTVMLGLLYKIARQFCSPILAGIAVLTASADLINCFGPGNFTEEYALPLIAAALYIFLAYFRSGKITNLRLFVLGAAFGGVLMLRANMAAVWAVLCVSVTVQCLARKQVRPIGRFALWFIAGAAAAIVPFVLWLAANHALADFWQDYVLFNMTYSSAGVSAVLTAMTSSIDRPIVWLCIAVLVYQIWRKRELYLAVSYLAAMALSLWMLNLSARLYEHYGMIMVPLFVFPLAIQLNMVENQMKHEPLAAMAIICLLMIKFICPAWWSFATRTAFGISWAGQNAVDSNTLQVLDVIETAANTDDKIIVCGNDCAFYVMSGREPASRYMYQCPISLYDTGIRERFIADLEKTPPKVFIMEKRDKESDIYIEQAAAEYLDENGYQNILENGKFTVYIPG